MNERKKKGKKEDNFKERKKQTNKQKKKGKFDHEKRERMNE